MSKLNGLREIKKFRDVGVSAPLQSVAMSVECGNEPWLSKGFISVRFLLWGRVNKSGQLFRKFPNLVMVDIGPSRVVKKKPNHTFKVKIGSVKVELWRF